jgi:hypothetical protein
LLAAGLACPRILHAKGVVVPLALQAKLTAKVAKYDRNLAGRSAAGVVKVAILEMDSAESRGAATRLERAFSHIDTVSGMPLSTTRISYDSASALAEQCRQARYSLLYITPGSDSQISKIGAALKGTSILTVGADPSYVASGAVLGFDLLEGSPKILVHLARARAQQVSFVPALLKLARVVDSA